MLFYVVGGLRVVWVRIFASIVSGDGGLRGCVCVGNVDANGYLNKMMKRKKNESKKKKMEMNRNTIKRNKNGNT